MAPPNRASARRRLAPSSAFPRTMTVCDGFGGSLGFDLDSRELEALTFACQSLLDGIAPPGASLMKVTAAEQVYLVSRPLPNDDAVCLEIASLYEPGARIRLTPDMARLVVALVEQGLTSRHGLAPHD
jgi:hypothetical protein